MSSDRPLWSCPRCGAKLVTPNGAHSCVVVELETHFAGKPLEIRELFDAWLALVERAGGPATVVPQKTRIALQRRVRFGSVHVRRHWLDCSLWLRRRAEHPLLRNIDDFWPVGAVPLVPAHRPGAARRRPRRPGRGGLRRALIMRLSVIVAAVGADNLMINAERPA